MQNKFFGSKLNTVLLFILIILVAVILRLMYANKQVYLPSSTENQSVENVKNPIEGNAKDLVILSLAPYSQVSGTINLSGEVKGGYFFEGNILVNVLDINKNIIKKSHGTALTNWMTEGPVSFSASVDFTGLPQGQAYVEIHNDNASGLSENDKSILVPIIIK